MAIRNSKRQLDGSIEYYDTKEEMEAANGASISWVQSIRHVARVLASDFNPILTVPGFFIGGALCFWLILDTQILEKWVSFIAVLLSATVGGYLFGRLGNVFFMLIIVFIGLSVVFGGGYFVWKLL